MIALNLNPEFTKLQPIVSAATQLLVLLLIAGAGLLLRTIQAHVKNQMAASALGTLAELAGHVAAGSAQAVATAGKVDPKALESAAMAQLQAVGSGAIATLLTHGGFTPAAVQATLATMLASAKASLAADASWIPVPPAPTTVQA